MSDLIIQDRDLTALLAIPEQRLRLERAGCPLPWMLELGLARVSVGLRGKPDSAQSHDVRLDRLTHRQRGPMHHRWIGLIGGAGVAFDMELVDGELVFSVAPTGDGSAELVSAVWPGELRFIGPEREVCWSDAQQGSLFRADGRPWSASVAWDHAAMRTFGFTAGPVALAVIVDTPLDARAAFADDGTGTMSATVVFRPALGSLRYGRRIRFIPLDKPGHVAVANQFREYAQATGLWRSWDSRVEENPNVAKLKGAFIACAGYFWDDGANQVAAMRGMREAGFETGYLFSPKLLNFGTGWNVAGPNRMTDRQLEQIHELGYLTAPFLQVEEANESIGPANLAVDADGRPIKRWQIDQHEFFEIAKWRVPDMLSQLDSELRACNAVHFDTLTAMSLVEHWGERPYDRRGDEGLRRDIAARYRDRGKVIGSESMRDWANDLCDYQTSKRFTPVDPNDRRIWTIPFTDLVYHDSVIRSIWEHHAYDDDSHARDLVTRQYHPFGQELTDLLSASPPVLFPEGMLYRFELLDTTDADGHPMLSINWAKTELYRKRFRDPATQAVLPAALRVCRLNRRHGVARMTAHRLIEPPFIQETEFETGLHVIVNFGGEPYILPDGNVVPARGCIIDE